MKTIQVVGDSLAGGPERVNFTRLLDNMLSDYTVCSDFAGGDPLTGVSGRLLEITSSSEADILVIEGGINDILLPTLKNRGGIWAKLIDHILERGNPPTGNLSDFKALYSDTIQILKFSVPVLITTTITCIGEDLNSEPNRRRKEFNEAIKEVSAEHGVILADTGNAFDLFLKKIETPSSYFQDRIHGAFTDSLFTISEGGLKRICSRRGLELTIDGVHFNHEGARLFAETVAETINKLES